MQEVIAWYQDAHLQIDHAKPDFLSPTLSLLPIQSKDVYFLLEVAPIEYSYHPEKKKQKKHT